MTSTMTFRPPTTAEAPVLHHDDPRRRWDPVRPDLDVLVPVQWDDDDDWLYTLPVDRPTALPPPTIRPAPGTVPATDRHRNGRRISLPGTALIRIPATVWDAHVATAQVALHTTGTGVPLDTIDRHTGAPWRLHITSFPVRDADDVRGFPQPCTIRYPFEWGTTRHDETAALLDRPLR